MKVFVLVLAVTCTLAEAQVVPTAPTKFGKRNLGAANTSTNTISSGTGSASAGVSLPKTQTVVRTVTYISLTPSRQWTSADGKPLVAKLIAFEDVTTQEVKTGAPAAPAPPGTSPAPTMPVLPGKPTVVKEGKVRLLVGQQPFELALDKLSAADRDFVGMIKHGVEGTGGSEK